MAHPDSAVVTGAFSYTGGYVARRLIDQGVGVRTLSRHPDSRNAPAAWWKRLPWTSRIRRVCAAGCTHTRSTHQFS